MKKQYPVLTILVVGIIAFNLGITLCKYVIFKYEEIVTLFTNFIVWLLGQA